MDYNRETNPAALIKVMPRYKGRDLPVAVFIKYRDSNFWQQVSREYHYKKCAVNKAREIEIQHYAYKFIKEA